MANASQQPPRSTSSVGATSMTLKKSAYQNSDPASHFGISRREPGFPIGRHRTNGSLRPISKFENDSSNSIIDSNFVEISFHLQLEVGFCEDRHFGKLKTILKNVVTSGNVILMKFDVINDQFLKLWLLFFMKYIDWKIA